MEPLYRERERERETPFLAPSVMYVSESPVKESSLQVPSLSSHADGRPVCRAFLYLSLKVSSKAHPFKSPVGAPMDRDAHFQNLLSLTAWNIR